MVLKKEHINYIAISLLISALIVVGISQRAAKPKATAINFGALFPLTGKFANFGQDSQNGALLALEKLKQAGEDVNIIFEDSAADPKPALLGANKLVNVDKVKIILGSLGSSANLAVAPFMQENKVLFVAVSANPKLKDSGDYVFKLHPDVDGEVLQMTEYLVSRGLKKVAVIYDSSSDTNTVAKDIFAKQFGQNGRETVSDGFDSRTTNDFKTIITKLQSHNPEALYILTVDQPAAVIIKQAKELNFNVPYFGWSGLVSKQLSASAGPAAEGLMATDYAFSCNGTEQMRQYCKDYGQKFPTVSPTEYGAHIYDAVNILARLVKQYGSDTEKVRQGLLDLKNYNGISGPISFDGKRYIQSQDFVFRVVKDGQFTELDK